jgi:serine/threonine-protein kinase
MTLAPGSRLGAFEIVSILGEGGMGRVYLARDTKLQRQVAVKVLRDLVAADQDRVARFEREARTLASLNHPHIAQIYGTEQSGGIHALVMELVAGEDLSQRIARGPIPFAEALPIARQVADALEAAHDQGIVHRDLKPANIKLSADGAVKVLDFGLAKAIDATIETGAASATITSPAMVTHAGMILGTAAYMSPEQAKGRPADKRSDVWAFGCVLYEMLTAQRAFPGDDVVDTLAAVVRGEPNLDLVPADVPRDIRTLIARCLIKDRRDRVSDMAVARYVLSMPQEHGAVPSASTRTANGWKWATVGLAAITAAAAVTISSLNTRPVDPPAIIRSTLAAPNAITGGFATLAMSRQGTHVAYASPRTLQVRRLSEPSARPLQGSEGGANPFFSYDGQWVGFFAAGKLKKVPVAGGAAQVLADAPSGRGGSWGADGTIVFAPSPDGGLRKVSADGGPVTVLTTPKPDERSHRWPHVLPGGRTVLFTIQIAGRQYDDAVIAAVPITGGDPTIMVEGGSAAQFVDSGHLIYGKAGSLLAVAFDPVAVRASGAAIAVVDDARTNALNGATPFAVSSAGTFVYLQGDHTTTQISLLAATRSGQLQPLLEHRVVDPVLRISPDGRRVAASINDGQFDIWLINLDDRSTMRFTFDNGTTSHPVWSPDGSRLYYATNSGGTQHTVTKSIDGSTAETALTTTAFFPMTITSDGGTLAGRAITANSFDVVSFRLTDPTAIAAVVSSNANETSPAFSPDGRYLAYQSDESGRPEIFVQSYPSGSRWQITSNGGTEPRWTSGGRELVYRSGGTIFGVPINLQPFSAGPSQTLFNVPSLLGFDVTADGKRFVIVQNPASRDTVDFVLITGWFEELKAKMRPTR